MRPFSHFHFSYSFKYIRLAMILSVVPLVQALLALDIPGLTSILGQELIILAAIFTFALLQWRAAGYHWGRGRITVQQGLLVRRQQVISRPMVAAVQLRRPLHYRILGASQVTFITSTAGTR
ncbi:MAG: PH domain-containing protein [Oscillospiraceae bacterium]